MVPRISKLKKFCEKIGGRFEEMKYQGHLLGYEKVYECFLPTPRLLNMHMEYQRRRYEDGKEVDELSVRVKDVESGADFHIMTLPSEEKGEVEFEIESPSSVEDSYYFGTGYGMIRSLSSIREMIVKKITITESKKRNFLKVLFELMGFG